MNRMMALATVVSLLTVSTLQAQTDAEKAIVKMRLEVAFSTYTRPLTPAQHGELLNRVAFDSPDWVLLGKKDGNNCPMPDGRLISCDILMYWPTLRGWDVIVDVGGINSSIGGPSGMGENLKPLIDNGSRTVEQPVDPGNPNPPPPPPPPPDQIKEILERLNGIDQQLNVLREGVEELMAVQDVQGKELTFQEQLILDIHARLNTLNDYVTGHQIAEGCQVWMLGIPLKCRLVFP